jgi:ribosomal protein S18 acetylase RimI-like enzyme
MAEFYVSLSRQEMAAQIADLINRYNRWYTRHTAFGIGVLPARYFVEISDGRVVGCAACQKEYPTLSKIFHICVDPRYRKKGIAEKLTRMAIAACDTEHVYMTIREDNVPSLKLAQKLGFVFVKKHWFKDHYTITVGRRK